MPASLRNIFRISFLLFIFTIVFPACEDDFNSSIPYVPVSFSVNLVNFNSLTIPSNSAMFPQGYGGVIVTNTGIGFYAMDAACPYEVDPQCRVEFDEGDVIATCPCCGSQYLLLDGGALLSGTGPSTEPLRPYSAVQSGNTIIVSN